MEDSMHSFIQSFLPPDYSEVVRRSVVLDGRAVELIRYQPNEIKNIQFGRTHFSVLIGEDGQLKGFYWLAPELAAGQLPGCEQAEDIAVEFLKNYAPDLYENREIHWCKPHDEKLVADGREITITGMKVKMRNPVDGRWFWVIVGRNQRPVIFERDIVWIRFPGKRQSEKWLHDAWHVSR